MNYLLVASNSKSSDSYLKLFQVAQKNLSIFTREEKVAWAKRKRPFTHQHKLETSTY